MFSRCYQTLRPHHVVIAPDGTICVDPNHSRSGNTRLMNRIQETFWGYEAADQDGKKSIAKTLVREVRNADGEFWQRMAHGHRQRLANAEAILRVQHQFNVFRATNQSIQYSDDNESIIQVEGFLVQEEEDDDSDATGYLLVDRDYPAPVAATVNEDMDLNGRVQAMVLDDTDRASDEERQPSPRAHSDDDEAEGFPVKMVHCDGKNDTDDDSMIAVGHFGGHEVDRDMDELDIVGPIVINEGEPGEKQYYGTVKDGELHGLGFMIYTKKKKWICGHWRNGRLHGLGGAAYEENHKCLGHFVNDRLHGRALYLTDVSKFVGEYRQHKRHGYGLLLHKLKGTFEGNFRDDRFEGRGEHRAINGEVFKGDFVNWTCVKNQGYRGRGVQDARYYPWHRL